MWGECTNLAMLSDGVIA